MRTRDIAILAPTTLRSQKRLGVALKIALLVPEYLGSTADPM